MKRIPWIILVVIGVFAYSVSAGLLQERQAAVIKARSSGGATPTPTPTPDPCDGYLVCEDAEGTGTPTGWTDSAAGGTVNWDYTTTILEGSQSLYVDEDTADVFTISPSVSGLVSGYALIRFPSWGNITDQFLLSLTDSGAVSRCAARIDISGTAAVLEARLNATNGTATVGTLATGTTYHLWVDYNDAADTCTVAFSTDGTKPSSGDNVSVATYVSTYALTYLRLPSQHTNISYIADHIRGDDAAIGSNPD